MGVRERPFYTALTPHQSFRYSHRLSGPEVGGYLARRLQANPPLPPPECDPKVLTFDQASQLVLFEYPIKRKCERGGLVGVRGPYRFSDSMDTRR